MQLRQESAQISKGGDNNICPDCNGLTWISYTDENGNEFAKPCLCQEKARLLRQIEFANLPKVYTDKTLATFSFDKYKTIEGRNCASVACKTVKYYLDNFAKMQDSGMGLYLYSHVKGSGKTRMAVGISNDLIHKHYQVRFAVSTDIIKEIKRTWENERRKFADYEDRQTESKLLDALGSAEVLVIDDFGMELESDWMKEKFFQIINDRYIKRKVTIFTSNYALDELKHDDRTVNRIKENTYQVRFPEESVRDYIAEENSREMIENLKRKG